jgi:hypothetical protein
LKSTPDTIIIIIIINSMEKVLSEFLKFSEIPRRQAVLGQHFYYFFLRGLTLEPIMTVGWNSKDGILDWVY